MEILQTALLIDGSENPVALRLDPRDQKDYIAQGRPNATPRNFKFVKKTGHVLLYRLDGEKRTELSDQAFEASAAAEADKFLRPERYKDMGKQGALNNSERDELERLRAQVAKEK